MRDDASRDPAALVEGRSPDPTGFYRTAGWYHSSVNAVFLHGLESSSRGTKGRWFAERFPAVRVRDYHGDLDEWLHQLTAEVAGLGDLVLVGSSFGALVAVCFAVHHPERCRRLVLLAPALNLAGYRPPAEPVHVEALVVVGRHDTVCPPDLVVALARASLRDPEIRLVDDDHVLHRTFPRLPWARLLGSDDDAAEAPT